MTDEINPYLQQEILTASPIRLRWMLIRRAEELCGEVNRLWADGQDTQATGWLLRIRDILGELLNGVQSDNPVSRSVSDLYVYLLKMLSQIEKGRDVAGLKRLEELLHIENETWQEVIRKFKAESTLARTDVAATSSKSIDAAPQRILMATPASLLSPHTDQFAIAGELNLEV